MSRAVACGLFTAADNSNTVLTIPVVFFQAFSSRARLSFALRSGVALASKTGNLSSPEAVSPSTPPSSSHCRPGRAPTAHLLSGLACSQGTFPGKTSGGLAGLLGPPSKEERGRKRIKAENGSSLLVVPYPVLASGHDQSCPSILAKEGKTYRWVDSVTQPLVN